MPLFWLLHRCRSKSNTLVETEETQLQRCRCYTAATKTPIEAQNMAEQMRQSRLFDTDPLGW